MAPVDLLALSVLSIAVLRGLFLGLIREAFSLAAIGAACVAVRWFAAPAAAELDAATGGRVGELAAPWIAAAAAVTDHRPRAATGRAPWASVWWTGRGPASAAEGSLVIAVLLLLGTTVSDAIIDLEATRNWRSFIGPRRRCRDIDVAAPPRELAAISRLRGDAAWRSGADAAGDLRAWTRARAGTCGCGR
jgi:hypothetical protein